MDVNLDDLRKRLAEIVNEIHFHGERVVVKKHGKPFIAMVPIAILDDLERAEDASDEAFVRSLPKGPRPRGQTLEEIAAEEEAAKGGRKRVPGRDRTRRGA